MLASAPDLVKRLLFFLLFDVRWFVASLLKLTRLELYNCSV